MKKSFEQPNFMVVRIKNDIIATSDLGYYHLTSTYDWEDGRTDEERLANMF